MVARRGRRAAVSPVRQAGREGEGDSRAFGGRFPPPLPLPRTGAPWGYAGWAWRGVLSRSAEAAREAARSQPPQGVGRRVVVGRAAWAGKVRCRVAVRTAPTEARCGPSGGVVCADRTQHPPSRPLLPALLPEAGHAAPCPDGAASCGRRPRRYPMGRIVPAIGIEPSHQSHEKPTFARAGMLARRLLYLL